MKEKLLSLAVVSLLCGCGGSGDGGSSTHGHECRAGNGDFIFPFSKGQTWMVCQGYNTPDIFHHDGDIHALDFSYDLDAANGPSGCGFSSANASAGQMVYAPADGSIAWYGLDDTPGIGIDVTCITLRETASNGAKSVMLGHLDINGFVSRGDAVKQGALLGRVNTPSARNGNYAHIHIATYDNKLCAGKSLPLNDVFGGTCNFTSNDSKEQWRGTRVTAPE